MTIAYDATIEGWSRALDMRDKETEEHIRRGALLHCHHERWDGKGYPRGLEGEQIPFEARIFTVVDVWDALRSDRPYRKAWAEHKMQGTIFFIRQVNILIQELLKFFSN